MTRNFSHKWKIYLLNSFGEIHSKFGILLTNLPSCTYVVRWSLSTQFSRIISTFPFNLVSSSFLRPRATRQFTFWIISARRAELMTSGRKKESLVFIQNLPEAFLLSFSLCTHIKWDVFRWGSSCILFVEKLNYMCTWWIPTGTWNKLVFSFYLNEIIMHEV